MVIGLLSSFFVLADLDASDGFQKSKGDIYHEQSKTYRIYLKSIKEWVDVNKEFYTNFYRDINAYRKRQQEHGRCVCPASKRYLCDMDCMTCPYAKAGDQLSLDNTVSDGEGK